MANLKKYLMERDTLTEEEAIMQIEEIRDRVREGADIDDIIDEYCLEAEHSEDIL